jgi:hypothetical protein
METPEASQEAAEALNTKEDAWWRAAQADALEKADTILAALTASAAPAAPREGEAISLRGFLGVLMDWQAETFGPRQTLAGLRNHFDKEWAEIEENPTDLKEWLGLLNLSLSGARLHGYTFEDVASGWPELVAELQARTWPDWRDADPSKAIEHDRAAPRPSRPDAGEADLLGYASPLASAPSSRRPTHHEQEARRGQLVIRAEA